MDDIRDIRPGETIDFDIELVGNQPQDLEIVVEAISRLMPTSTFTSQRTRVILSNGLSVAASRRLVHRFGVGDEAEKHVSR